MTPLFSLPSRITTLVVLALSPFVLRAQIGDNADKPGFVQVPIVPAHLIPPAPALTPEEALKTFRLPPGYKLEIAAAEPLVQDPVAIRFGPDGRMWVAEMRGYMPDLDGRGEDLPVGRIVVLSDQDGDGRYDHSQVFLDELVLPRALTLIEDGLLVGAPPELAFWRDTDGDGKADAKEVVATDYGVRTDPQRPFLANPERAPNSLLYGLDNWIHSTAYIKKFRRVNGTWQTGTALFRGQWGLTQDDFGRIYSNSNSDHLRVDVIPADYLRRNPNYPRLAGTNVNAAADQLVWPARLNPGINRGYRPEFLRDGYLKEFTAACAPWIYRGDLLPEFHGHAFIAEPSGNFVRRSVLTAADGTVRAVNAMEKGEFIASTDERFRPVNFMTGPDGALYIVDLYRGVLQHRISLTSYLRKQSEDRGLAAPIHHGRIYRLVRSGETPPLRSTALPPRTTMAWVRALGHPNAWWRETAQQILVERQDRSLIPVLEALALSDTETAGRVHALWTLEGLAAISPTVLSAALKDKAPAVRASALRLSEAWLQRPDTAELKAGVVALARDPDPAVQLQAMLTLGEGQDPYLDRQLVEVVLDHPFNPFLIDAFLSGIATQEMTLLEHVLTLEDGTLARIQSRQRLLTELARGVYASRRAGDIARVLALASANTTANEATTRALLDGFAAAAALAPRALRLDHAPDGWARLEASPGSKKARDVLQNLLLWPGKPGATDPAAEQPLTLAQQTRLENGRILFTGICAPCHQPGGEGLDGVAPPLLDSPWVLGPPERTVRIALQGVRGPINVLGRWHTGEMPAFGGLDNHQLSSILTYVRRAWGHTAPAVDPEQVEAIRRATAGRTDAWTQDELNLIKPEVAAKK